MADTPKPQDQPAPAPAPAPSAGVSSDEPEWAKRLREAVEQLPGKLTAFISDDDKRGIAEHVHGLFESSGAFEAREADADPPEDEVEPDPEADNPPAKTTWAERHFGRF